MTTTAIIKRLLLMFLVFGTMHYGKDILIPIAIGAVIATLFIPLSNRLERFGMARWVSTLICVLLFFTIIGGMGSLIGWQVSELSGDFEKMKTEFIKLFNSVSAYLYDQFGMSPKQQSELLLKQQSRISTIIQDLVSSLSALLSQLLLISVFFIFLLYYRGHIKNFVLKFSIGEEKKETEKVVYKVANVSQQYLLGLIKMIMLLWVMYGIGFTLLGVKNALFFAFLCGILEVIPYIGNLIGTTLTLLVALVNGANLTMLIGIVSTYGIVQFIQGWVLEPLIVGSQVKINPLFTIIALLLGEFIWGISGVFLAIPVLAMLKIVFDNIDGMKPYGYLIGEIEMNRKSPGWIDRIRKKIFKG